MDNKYCLATETFGRPTYLSEAISEYSWIVTFIGIIIVFSTSVIKHLFSNLYTIGFKLQIRQFKNSINKNRYAEIILIIFSISSVSSLLNDFSYLLSVLYLTFNFITITVGLVFQELKKTNQRLWIISLTLFCILNMVRGSRGVALYPVVFFVIGYVLSVKDKRKIRKTILMSALFLYPLFSIMSAAQGFREEFGRGIEITKENVGTFFDFLISSDEYSSSTDIVSNSLGRFLNHSDFAVIHLSPDPIGFREFEQMNEELLSIVSLSGGSENIDAFNEARSGLKYGVGVLTSYGFYITDKTSTGLGLLADSYSRFGMLGIAIYFLLFSLLCYYLECKSAALIYKKPILSICLTSFLFYNICFCYGNSYYVLLKIILFRGLLLYFVISYLITPYAKITKNQRYENCNNWI